MKKLYRLLTGYYEIRFLSPYPERLLDAFLKWNLPVFNIGKKEGELCFSFLSYHKKRFLPLLSSLKKGEEAVWKKRGMLALFQRFGKRWGLLLGSLLALLLLVFSTFFVWSVEIEGNLEIPDRKIVELLAEEGLKTGAKKSDFSPSEFALTFQVNNPQFSFASLNFVGTRAIVTVRERKAMPPLWERGGEPCNLVASFSGQIMRFESLEGQVMIKQWDTVPKGALLISGVRERKNGSFSVCRAEGSVFAKTERVFETTVPYDQRENVLSGREKTVKGYDFLSLSWRETGWEEPPFSDFAVTESFERLTFFGIPLPIVVSSKTYYERVEKNSLLTVDTAKKKAYDIYEEYKGETFASGYEILEETVSCEEREDRLFLRIEIVAVEDIATPQPFSFTEF